MEIRKSRISPRLLIAVALIVFGAALRFLPHIPNFAPIGAIALFGGAVLGWRLAIWLPLAVMILSDFLIGSYSDIEFTWSGFLLVALFGMLLRKASFLTKVSLGALGSGVIFFVVSNFGTWLTSGMYASTLQGLAECYYMALPFLRNSLMGDLFYSFALFGTYELAMRFATERRFNRQKSPVNN